MRLNKFGIFLVLLSGGIMMTACKKEEMKTENGFQDAISVKKAPQKPKAPSNGREFKNEVNDCIDNPVACAPYDVVVTPTGTTIEIYSNFKKSIANGEEHNFFADKNQVSILFPFLLDDEWKEFYELTQNPELKFIEFKMGNGKIHYFLVPDELDPSKFEAGMEYLDLVLILK